MSSNSHSRKVALTKRWRAQRWQALRRDGFHCRLCGRRGRLEVDHIRSVATYPEGVFDLNNLQSLCASCDTRKTRAENGRPEVSEERKNWRKYLASLEKNPEIP